MKSEELFDAWKELRDKNLFKQPCPSCGLIMELYLSESLSTSESGLECRNCGHKVVFGLWSNTSPMGKNFFYEKFKEWNEKVY